MKHIARFADYCYEGLTLKHVSHKDIVIPYVCFVMIALLFELFLIGLAIYSIFVFYSFNYKPDFSFYLTGAILILILVLTLIILKPLLKKLAANK